MPNIVTASTNRNLLQPTRENRKRRKSKIAEIQHSVAKGKHRSSLASEEPSSSKSRKPLLGSLIRHKSSSSSSAKSDRSQLVDLVVEDREAENMERVRARKEGGPGWNEASPKHFIHAYPEEGQAEEVREGFDPDRPQPHNPEAAHNLDSPFAVGDGDEDDEDDEGSKDKQPIVSAEAERWEHRDYDDEQGKDSTRDRSPQYGSFHEERNAWGTDDR